MESRKRRDLRAVSEKKEAVTVGKVRFAGRIPPEIPHPDPYLPREASPAREATVGYVHTGDRVALGLSGQLVFLQGVQEGDRCCAAGSGMNTCSARSYTQ